MSTKDLLSTNRRGFLGSLATGAAALGISTLGAPLQSYAGNIPGTNNADDPDAWFNKIKGKHRVVFDVTEPNAVFPFAWPRIFLLTNGATGTPEKDVSVVVVLRHDAIPYAMEDRLWGKYKFADVFKAGNPGPVFKASDAATAHTVRNPFWKPKAGDFVVPGFGEVQIGINQLQESGVMFCVCEAALTVYSAGVAQMMNLDAAEVRKDWVAGIFPGIQPVPSGVWALGRAQERGCAYIFAG